LRSNLHYEAAIHGVLRTDNEREVDYIVERLALTTELDKRWHELSGGYKLRFALARALVWKPALLVLDEPLANLDFIAQQVVLKDLRHLADSLRYPLSVFVSSQHVHEIEEVSDKLLVLQAGEMKYFGGAETIGEDRHSNRFELAGDVHLRDLQSVFSGSEYRSVYYSGVSFVLTTSVNVTPETVFRRIIEANLRVTYFRDISRSAKSLVQGDDAD
jgi:ABC-2 type transport system ATP-binding protein